ncbi:MAG TPA: MbnP family protein [Candidatus Krumholzibacteria bacterium]|nr:MbnP family protein [Candidatus Krumholzibacteria bacterium]
MFRTITRVLAATVAVSLLVLLGCGNDSTTAPVAPITADVLFHLNVSGAPLIIDSGSYTNDSGTQYTIKTVRFVVSDMTMHASDGKVVTLTKMHFYDVADYTTQTIHATGLPHDTYDSVTFRFGLSTADNVPGKYPSIPPVFTWPPALGSDLGYHYMQLEGNYTKTAGGTAGYTTHTGPRHLDTDATPYDFSFVVTIPFAPTHIHEGGNGQLEINFDLNGWYTDHNPADGVDTEYDFNALSSQMIMGDLDAQGKLQTNGPACFTATLTAVGGHDH